MFLIKDFNVNILIKNLFYPKITSLFKVPSYIHFMHTF